MTHSSKGFEKLKDVLWKVFDGKEFHRNEDETGQLSFFTTEDEKELRAKEYATEAKRMLLKKYSGTKVSYPIIEMYLIENTMLREGKISVLNLCFSTDPFMMNQDKIIELSMEILKRLNTHDIVCSVLTKGLLPIELEKLNKKNQYGITVITLDDDFRKKWNREHLKLMKELSL